MHGANFLLHNKSKDIPRTEPVTEAVFVLAHCCASATRRKVSGEHCWTRLRTHKGGHFAMSKKKRLDKKQAHSKAAAVSQASDVKRQRPKQRTAKKK